MEQKMLTNVIRVHKLSKDTMLAEGENLFSTLFSEGEKNYKNPKQCVGNVTIRANKKMVNLYLGYRNFVERQSRGKIEF
ncbi:hypothetical protein ACIQXI_10955 [Lysinibacillus sp. NPDC097195]|uniref:hypothetical protein n=1 Tax=Lysinibacillus sp. NPDC097195 TaxID=3364141 RepID=UPI00380A4FC6